MTPAEAVDLVGQVWDYVERDGHLRRAANDPLKIVRPGKRNGDWLAIRLLPREWERKGQEWLIVREQIAEGRYVRRLDVEAKLAVKRAERLGQGSS